MGNESLTQLLSQLDVRSTKDEFAKVEQKCMNLLNNRSKGVDMGSVLKAYLVVLIKQDKYDQGYKILLKKKDIDEKFGDQIALEKLYIFYKLNKTCKFEELYQKLIPESIDSITVRPEDDITFLRGILHVRAQFCYKNGLHEETYKIYHYLASHNSKGNDNDLELRCNERVPLAADPSLQFDLDVTSLAEESYDLLYNNSMVLSARGHYKQALELLGEARQLAAKDGYESDLHAIDLQLAFVYQMMGKSKESNELLDAIISRLDKNSPIALLANMNKSAFIDHSKYKANLNLVLRELNVEAMNGINRKQFTQEQWSIINRNILFLHLFNNDSIQSKNSLLSRTLHNYRKVVDNVGLETYKSQANKLYHYAFQMIESGTGGSVIGFLLLTLQILVTEKRWDNAIRLGEHFLNKLWKTHSELKYSANDKESMQTVCCILFELYKVTGRNDSKGKLLQHLTADLSRAESDPQFRKELPFWKHVAFKNLELGGLTKAEVLFEQISKISKDKLIQKILSDEDLNVGEGIRITQGVDVEALVSAGTKPLESTKASDNVVNSFKVKKVQADRRKERKKRERLARFLKHHDVHGPVDPERWLPKRDRATYRPKKKQLAKQTQGGAVSKRAEQSLDISKKTMKGSKKTKGRNK